MERRDFVRSTLGAVLAGTAALSCKTVEATGSSAHVAEKLEEACSPQELTALQTQLDAVPKTDWAKEMIDEVDRDFISKTIPDEQWAKAQAYDSLDPRRLEDTTKQAIQEWNKATAKTKKPVREFSYSSYYDRDSGQDGIEKFVWSPSAPHIIRHYAGSDGQERVGYLVFADMQKVAGAIAVWFRKLAPYPFGTDAADVELEQVCPAMHALVHVMYPEAFSSISMLPYPRPKDFKPTPGEYYIRAGADPLATRPWHEEMVPSYLAPPSLREGQYHAGDYVFTYVKGVCVSVEDSAVKVGFQGPIGLAGPPGKPGPVGDPGPNKLRAKVQRGFSSRRRQEKFTVAEVAALLADRDLDWPNYDAMMQDLRSRDIVLLPEFRTRHEERDYNPYQELWNLTLVAQHRARQVKPEKFTGIF